MIISFQFPSRKRAKASPVLEDGESSLEKRKKRKTLKAPSSSYVKRPRHDDPAARNSRSSKAVKRQFRYITPKFEVTLSSQPLPTENLIKDPSLEESICHIHRISDKELLQIFRYLPLTQQITVERVCSRWQEFSISACLDRSSLRIVQDPSFASSLTEICRLFFFNDHQSWLPLEESCLFVRKQMTEAQVDWLGQRFPRVKYLALYCVDRLPVELFARLVGHLTQVETLELFCSETQKKEYHCPTFWDAVDNMHHLSYIHLPFDYTQMGESNAVLDRLYNRVTMLFHRSNNTRTERVSESEVFYLLQLISSLYSCPQEAVPNDEPHPSAKVSPLKRCCLMDEDGRLGQFLLRFDHRPTPDDPINAVITGLGLYSGHIQIRELSQRLNLVKFGTLVMNNENNITHVDLDVPCNVTLSSFLAHFSTLQALTHLRITARRDPQTRQPEALFGNVTLENYTAVLTPVINRLQVLVLSRFDIASNDVRLVHYFPHMFPALTDLHFEDCRLQRDCTFYRSVFTGHFPQLKRVWHNNHILLEVVRTPVNGEQLTEVQRDQVARMIKKIPLLYKKRAKFALLHEVAKRVNGNFRINGAEFVSFGGADDEKICV